MFPQGGLRQWGHRPHLDVACLQRKYRCYRMFKAYNGAGVFGNDQVISSRVRSLVMHMRKKTVSLLVLAALAVTLPACAGVKPALTAERPKDEAFRTALKQ